MCQAHAAVQAIARAAPYVAALILAVATLAQIALVVPGGGVAAGTSARRGQLAVCAGSARRTDARVAGNPVDARSAAHARVTGALVDVYATVGPSETRRALASEPIDTVDAATTIETGQRLTVVHVLVTVRPFEALLADAAIATVGDVHARGPVLAGAAGACWRRDVTGGALPARRTVTGETVAAILTGAAVTAGSGLAVAGAQGAGLALPAVATDAREVGQPVDAGTVVPTGQRRALVHV